MANPPSSSSYSSQSSPFFPAVETNTLPQDLLLEILPRLPVKSLVRFRAVHTSWQSLFQNPNFISAHSRRSNLQRPRKVLLNTHTINPEGKASFFFYGDTLDAVDTSEISNLVGGASYSGLYTLVGSCNGVFCVTESERNKFLLWNPATRETMLLPPPPLLRGTGQRNYAVVGFGLDPQGGDLKIVRLIMVCEKDEPRYSAEVYSIKSHCWRKIQFDLDLSEEAFYFMDEAYCNGSYHWVNWEHKMLSFDMTREVFEWGKLPRAARWWNICAGLSGCLLGITCIDTRMEVWSMVGAKSWKLVKGFELTPSLREYFELFFMAVWMDDDEVLLGRRSNLCILNITKQEVRQVRVPGDVFPANVFQLLPYVESLVSIRNFDPVNIKASRIGCKRLMKQNFYRGQRPIFTKILPNVRSKMMRLCDDAMMRLCEF